MFCGQANDVRPSYSSPLYLSQPRPSPY